MNGTLHKNVKTSLGFCGNLADSASAEEGGRGGCVCVCVDVSPPPNNQNREIMEQNGSRDRCPILKRRDGV